MPAHVCAPHRLCLPTPKIHDNCVVPAHRCVPHIMLCLPTPTKHKNCAMPAHRCVPHRLCPLTPTIHVVLCQARTSPPSMIDDMTMTTREALAKEYVDWGDHDPMQFILIGRGGYMDVVLPDGDDNNGR